VVRRRPGGVRRPVPTGSTGLFDEAPLPPIGYCGPAGPAHCRRRTWFDLMIVAAQPPPLASTTMVELSGAPGHTFTLQFPARIKDPVLHLAPVFHDAF
jgi:hypothetical protein